MKNLVKVMIMFLLIDVFYFGFTSGQSNAKEFVKRNRNIPIALVIEDEIFTFEKGYPYISNVTTYAPIKEFSKKLGVQVTVTDDQEILLKKGEKSLLFSSKKQTVELENGHSQLITFFKKEDIWYAPVRFIGEHFGFKVDSVFADNQHIVRLTKNSKTSHIQIFKHKHEEIEKYYDFIAGLNKPKIYLTFDDGPTNGMRSILDTLEKYDAKATFFMLEPLMRYYPELVKELVDDGHYPGLHSVSHDKSKLYGQAPTPFINEMLQTQETLYEITGKYSFITRAPYGSKPYLNQQYLDALVSEGMKMWDWNVDPQDWKYQSTQPEKIVENIKSQVESVEHQEEPIVILLHVRPGTAEILPEVILYLQEMGYELAAYDPNDHFPVNFWKDERL